MSFASLEATNAFNMAYAFALMNGSDKLHILEKDGQIVDAICLGHDVILKRFVDHTPYQYVFRWDQEKFDQGLLPFNYDEHSTDDRYKDYKELFIWNIAGLYDDIKVSSFKSLIENSINNDIRQKHVVNLELVLSMGDPLLEEIWSCENGNEGVKIDIDVIKEMIKNQSFPPKILSPEEWDELDREQASLYHNGRIAQIYHEGENGTISKPISIILNKIDETRDTYVNIDDGFHRLAAMTLMEYEKVECLASQQAIAKLLMNKISYENGFLECVSKLQQNPIVRYQHMIGVWAQDVFITTGDIFSLNSDGIYKLFLDHLDHEDHKNTNIISPPVMNYKDEDMENSVKYMFNLMGVEMPSHSFQPLLKIQ